MATYYNYVERTADSQINWAEVGKNMTDMLQQESKVREQKKAAIDAASREFGQTLANPPQGEHKGANQWALEYGDNASQFMLMQDRLLKSGNMKLKDYTVARQNLLDGTDRAFNLTKDYQAVFADKMERYKTGKSQDLEQWLMAQAEGYSDFNKSQLYINPTDGTVSVAMKEKKVIDGKEVYAMNSNPNEFTSINTLRNQITGKFDRFDTNAVTDAFAKGLGDEMKATQTKLAKIGKTGEIVTIADITSRTDIDPETKKIMFKFIDAENQMIDAALANPYNRLSVLTNSKKFAPNGKQYSFTYNEDEAKANPDKVLLKLDPSSGQATPQFSEEQKKVSQDFMRNEARAKYDYKEDLKVTAPLEEPRARTAPEIDAKERELAAKNFADNLATALTGTDPVAIGNAIKYLEATSKAKVTRTATGISVTDESGKSIPFNFIEGGKPTNPMKIFKAIIPAFGTRLPEDAIIKFGSGFIGGKPLELKTSASGSVSPKAPTDPLTVYGSTIDKSITADDVEGKSKSDAAKALNSKLSGLGVTVKGSINPLNDDIFIVTEDKKESPKFDVTKEGVFEEIKNWIKANPSGKTDAEKKANIKRLIKTGVIKGGEAGELD